MRENKLKSKLLFPANSKSRIKVIESKSLFIRIRDKINELDQSLSWVLIIDITETMIAIMFNIYAMAIVANFKKIEEHVKTFAFKSITSIIKLIISFINGLVKEESIYRRRIYAVLDQLNGENLDEKHYKDLILFKNVSKDNEFGFTIGGFAALRKTTLILVKMKSKQLIKLIFILIVLLFLFILFL